MARSALTDSNITYRPFRSPWAFEFWKRHETEMHWVPEEANVGDDISDWKSKKMSPSDKEFITQILRMFTQMDKEVGGYYYDVLIPHFKNNEVRMALGSVASREAIHQVAYALVNDTLGLPEGEYTAFMSYKEMMDKYEFMIDANPKTIEGLALALVKTICNEGILLFSSFAMLLNFERFGKMKGMCKVVEWSVKDEDCFTSEFSVQTSKGWKKFSELDGSELVAQFDMETNEITYVKPTRLVKRKHTGDVVKFHRENGAIDITVTPNHDMVILNEFNGKVSKVKAKDFRRHSRIHVPTAGFAVSKGDSLSDMDRFNIALQADGTIDKRISGVQSGCHVVCFNLTNSRKKNRITELLANLGFEFSVSKADRKNRQTFRVKVPVEFNIYKTFEEWGINYSEVSKEWAEDFIQEVAEWDGSRVKNSGRIHYGSVIESNADIVQNIGMLAGYRSKITRTPDTRKESHSDYFRVSILPNQVWTRTGNCEVTTESYDGYVYCVTMPKGTVVVRSESGAVGITGNCHTAFVTRLFTEYCKEHPRIVTDQFKKTIYDMVREAVRLEDAFIDLVFSNFKIEGITPEDVKAYIRYVGNLRLVNLGLKPNWEDVNENPLEWMDYLLSASKHTNFFENKSAEYATVAALEGDFVYPCEKPKSVTIYSRSGCGYCDEAKRVLNEERIPYVEIDLSNEADRHNFFVERGFEREDQTMPKIYDTSENDEKYIGGCKEFKKLVADSHIELIFSS